MRLATIAFLLLGIGTPAALGAEMGAEEDAAPAEPTLLEWSNRIMDLSRAPLNMLESNLPLFDFEDSESLPTSELERDAQLVQGNGELIPISTCYAPLFDKNDKLGGFVIVCHDIRERKAAELEMKRFYVLGEGKSPEGHTMVPCHITMD